MICANIVVLSSYKDILKMVLKCSFVRCIANYDCYDRGAVFSLPEKEEQKKQSKGYFKSKGYFIYKESQYLLQTLCRQSSEEGLKRTKLLYEYEPVPTIIPMTRENENVQPNAIFETIETPKKPPRQKIIQEDQMKPFKEWM